MPPTLRVVRSTSEQVTLPRYLVVEAGMEAKAVTDELDMALEVIAQRIFAGNRAGAIHEIERTHWRLERARSAFLELSGIADTTPTEPGAALHAAA